MASTLYDRIGAEFIERAITEFYQRAFVDPIICHLFMGKDQSHLTSQQIAFATNMLGGPRTYRGPSLTDAHVKLRLKPTHFRRRQVIMKEVLEELGLNEELRGGWLKLEDQLRSLIINEPTACNS